MIYNIIHIYIYTYLKHGGSPAVTMIHGCVLNYGREDWMLRGDSDRDQRDQPPLPIQNPTVDISTLSPGYIL